jgi:hypothetical protein
MGNDVFPHEYILKDPFALYLFSQFLGGGTALEVVGVDDLTMPDIRYFQYGGRFTADKVMQPRYAYPGLPVVFVLVIIADLVKIITVIKNADPDQTGYLVTHDSVTPIIVQGGNCFKGPGPGQAALVAVTPAGRVCILFKAPAFAGLQDFSAQWRHLD